MYYIFGRYVVNFYHLDEFLKYLPESNVNLSEPKKNFFSSACTNLFEYSFSHSKTQKFAVPLKVTSDKEQKKVSTRISPN